uniref:Uncharacterized protein n=1 Tax=Arundo donax TaxID=35708 RepID=A0A0A9BZQ1_ARUDO
MGGTSRRASALRRLPSHHDGTSTHAPTATRPIPWRLDLLAASCCQGPVTSSNSAGESTGGTPHRVRIQGGNTIARRQPLSRAAPSSLVQIQTPSSFPALDTTILQPVNPGPRDPICWPSAVAAATPPPASSV